MKVKGFIIMTVSYVILSIALDLVIDELDWRSVISSIVQAIIFSSLTFTLGFKFLKRLGNKLANSVPAVELTKDERLLLESPATHIKRREGVGGKLFLTDKRLVFKSHKFNLQNHEQELPLNQINTVMQGEGIYERVVEVTSADNKIERFVVESPPRWIQLLQQQLT